MNLRVSRALRASAEFAYDEICKSKIMQAKGRSCYLSWAEIY
jgi:hypothetical protein